MKMIAIIPARSGSKGLKDKNIKELNGKPLLAYSIEEAKKSAIFDTVMVSTDSAEYAQIAIKYGAEVPFLRSKETSSDNATTRACILEVLMKYQNIGSDFDKFMILQPTSPLRTAKNIIEANELYIRKRAKTVVSVCEVDHSPLWCNQLERNLSLKDFVKEENNISRQYLKPFYRINGAIYLHDVVYYMENEYYFDENAYAYIMKREESIDIDDSLDFLMAEAMFKERKL